MFNTENTASKSPRLLKLTEKTGFFQHKSGQGGEI
jgi:hypothetical protein